MGRWLAVRFPSVFVCFCPFKVFGRVDSNKLSLYIIYPDGALVPLGYNSCLYLFIPVYTCLYSISLCYSPQIIAVVYCVLGQGHGIARINFDRERGTISCIWWV